MLTRKQRKNLANELDSYLTTFEEITDSSVQNEKEELTYDARYIAEFITQLQDILIVLDKEQQLIKE